MIVTLFIIFALVSFFALFPIRNGKINLGIYVCFGLILFFYAAFRDGDLVRDYKGYITMYEMHKKGLFVLTDPTFLWITNISNSSLMLFFIYACIGVVLKLFAIKQLTELWFLALIVYISNFFILHELTQIRAGIAAGLLLLCIKPIYERNFWKFLLVCIIAFLFHASALIIFPLYFLGYKKPRKLILALSIPIAYLFYFSKISIISVIPIPIIQAKIENYQNIQEMGIGDFAEINVFNIVFLFKILIFYFFLWKYEIITKHNNYAPILMKIFAFSLISFPLFATMPVMGFRISELYGIVEVILFPVIYYIFNPQIISRLVVVILGFSVLCITIFFNKLIQL